MIHYLQESFDIALKFMVGGLIIAGIMVAIAVVGYGLWCAGERIGRFIRWR